MPLSNFGAILSFAEEMIAADTAFYEALARRPEAGEVHGLLEAFIRDGRKAVKTLQRTRRENVTEMILEPVQGLERTFFGLQYPEPGSLRDEALVKALADVETRAEAFFSQAGEKLHAQPEVSRTLKRLAKLHAGHRQALEDL